MQASQIAAPETADEGRERIQWVRRNMPILRALEAEFRDERPFDGLRAVVSIHLEAKTAYLAETLRVGGAEVAVLGSNSQSTKDDVAAALAQTEGIEVYAHHGASPEEMEASAEIALDVEPHLVLDDGGDLVELLHRGSETRRRHVLGVCEETTSGVLRARAREAAGELLFPVLLINDARCKYLFDNVHGTGQSVWDAIMRSTNLAISGKVVAIVGFGWCGQGCALRARGLGAQVVVCEVDPVRAAEAAMLGYRVLPLERACEEVDIVLTVTGGHHILKRQHFDRLKDGALVANAGHFRHEIQVEALEQMASRRLRFREQVEGFQLPSGRWVHLLGDGNIVNIACGDGHPAEIMDTSFALQALSVRHLARSGRNLEAAAFDVPEEIDDEVARRKLASLAIEIDELTKEQREYESSW